MERVHYRRYAPSRLEPNVVRQAPVHSTQAAESGSSCSLAEKFIIQGIISGIILAVVLFLSIVDNPHAMGIRGNLSQAISGHITAEQVAAEINRLLELPVEGLPILPAPAYAEEIPQFTEPEALPYAEMPVDAAPRIDEDIFREIFGYTDGDNLQTTAPEPMIIPEL